MQQDQRGQLRVAGQLDRFERATGHRDGPG
jgi:hypothetical protein